MKHGAAVSAFERAFAERVGARFAVAAANGTVTLQAALVALGVKPGDRVAVPPLTMAATTIAVLNVGAVPVFHDVEPDTWLLNINGYVQPAVIPVSLYGLQVPAWRGLGGVVEDAAQTMRQHGEAEFTSYSFQRSKILQVGEGGALVTDDESLAVAAREYLSLGYRMGATQSRIDSAAIKAPDYARHYRWPAINGRMNDHTAALALTRLRDADARLEERAAAAYAYARAVDGCDWLTPQHTPDGWQHDHWAYAVACDTPERAVWLQGAMRDAGAEIPYGAWRLTYHEPTFRHLAPDGTCPVAESLQPRIVAFQTNNPASAERNARALRCIIADAQREGRD